MPDAGNGGATAGIEYLLAGRESEALTFGCDNFERFLMQRSMEDRSWKHNGGRA
jgi:hypothetical protein